MIQRIILYFTLGMVLVASSLSVADWQFWCIVALFWCSERLTRQEVEETAMAEGISRFLNMTSAEQNKIKQLHNKIQKEENER
jgi:hypothetical protein